MSPETLCEEITKLEFAEIMTEKTISGCAWVQLRNPASPPRLHILLLPLLLQIGVFTYTTVVKLCIVVNLVNIMVVATKTRLITFSVISFNRIF